MENNIEVKEIMCRYCGRYHTIPVNPPERVFVYVKDAFDEFVIPATFVDVSRTEEGEAGTDVWPEDFFTQKELEKYNQGKKKYKVNDADISFALFRIYGRPYIKVEEHIFGGFWERVEWFSDEALRILQRDIQESGGSFVRWILGKVA